MQEFCLHPLIATRHDKGVLFEALHGLSSGQAAALLRYLHNWLRNHTQFAAGPQGLAGTGRRLPLHVAPRPFASSHALLRYHFCVVGISELHRGLRFRR